MECAICVNNATLIFEYDCGHSVCHVCGTRLLKLYNNHKCPLCKEVSKRFFVKSLKKQRNKNITECNITYQNDGCQESVQKLLRNKCKKCGYIGYNMRELIGHYRNAHLLLMCTECIENKKLFWFEHVLYTTTALQHHKNGNLNEDGFRGHILCVHCNLYLYDEMKAKQHCNTAHILCTLCDILGNKYRYYNTYKDLEIHFKNAHYCCTYKYCVGIKAYAFPYRTELLEHLVRYHKENTQLQDIRSGSCNIKYMDPYYKKNKVVSKVLNDVSYRNVSEKMATLSIKDKSISYLDKSKIEKIKKSQMLRKSLIRRADSKNHEIACEIIEKIIAREYTVEKGFDTLKSIIESKTLLRLIRELNFDAVETEVRDYYKILERQILFPKFEKNKTISSPKQPERKVGFKVLNLDKKGNR